MSEYFAEGDFAYFVLNSRRERADRPSLYVSAGIHGDEPAGTEALITWVEQDAATLRDINLCIFPCLNPWGLVNNSRLDAEGVDRNRSYHNDLVPATAAHVECLGVREFDVAIMLHEDFDATGYYLYEIQCRRPSWGPLLLAAASGHVALDVRSLIDTSRAKAGLIRRRIHNATFTHHPEAFPIHFHHSQRTFTVESPSEHALPVRVNAHVAVLRKTVDILKSTR